jgi:hypothetical protein
MPVIKPASLFYILVSYEFHHIFQSGELVNFKNGGKPNIKIIRVVSLTICKSKGGG